MNGAENLSYIEIIMIAVLLGIELLAVIYLFSKFKDKDDE